MSARFYTSAVIVLLGVIMTSCTQPYPLVYRVDQTHPRAQNSRSMGVVNGNPIEGSFFQSFTPSRTSLAAVSLRFQSGGSFPQSGVSSKINIREGSHDGTVIGTAVTSVTGPMDTGVKFDVIYIFPTALTLVSGQTYLIEWEATAGAVMKWMFIDGTNPYPNGGSFGSQGNEYPNDDFVFVVYF